MGHVQRLKCFRNGKEASQYRRIPSYAVRGMLYNRRGYQPPSASPFLSPFGHPDGRAQGQGLDFNGGKLEKEQAEKEAQLSALKNDMEARKGDAQTLSAEKEKLENELAAIQNKLADKQEKLQTADRQLSELKENMDAIQERTEELKEEAYKYSRDVHSKVDSLLKDAMLENMVNEWREMSAKMKPSERQLFDDTLLCSVAERGTEVMRCATMLFLGMVDDATTFAETHGGGGGGNDLKWGRDEDEDNRAWALRCMKMASRMMRPSSGKKPNDKWQQCITNQSYNK